MVPKLLSDDQKARRMQVCENTLQNIENDPKLLTKVVTRDEAWVFEYDPETKRQSKQWLSPGSLRPKKARQSRSQIKVMLIAFFDARGIVHVEFISQRQTVNQHVYQRSMPINSYLLSDHPDHQASVPSHCLSHHFHVFISF